MRYVAVLLAAVPLAACATSQPMDPDVAERVAGADGACNAAAAAQLVGQSATPALGARALELTGARTLRWGPPDSAMTMDYRQDRVNVFYDRQMRVERITCG
ncbi:I78 family peptidase inhibitor [Porphyrobacter sp. GA68]|uniref:I78 family peptidase inhibitor n=1 Tax=Porphyrobacter sp. GA68 TaxID=2883480 RepID=UPI001D17E153|nr:I78 family peptidase inhibitor [Porphyrobacter sp. GA68]